MKTQSYLALDLGAGSGRAIAGRIDGSRLIMDEVLRFENQPVTLGDTVYWDFPSLFANILQGITATVRKGYELQGIGVDTWGVDFGLLDAQGRLLSNPATYRDRRTEGMAAAAEKSVPKKEMYRITGIQQMEMNTIYQLLSLQRRSDPALGIAQTLLMMPDLVNYFLTGQMACEYTIASTTQLLDAGTRQWNDGLFERLGLPRDIMECIVFPGEKLGSLHNGIIVRTGAANASVYAVGSHDTASAIGAIPASGDDQAFLSSGTWSLMGVTTAQPILTDEALEGNFTNEGGVDGQILFMRNITGLWLLQRLIAQWKDAGEAVSYETLLGEAACAAPLRSIVDSDNPAFSNPADMAGAIASFCSNTGQPAPQTRGEMVRCVLESLALKYRMVMQKLETCTGRHITTLHIVGGGSRNTLLNSMISDALGITVVTGLTEATAAGNIIQQAIAAGQVKDWSEGRSIIGRSIESEVYTPQENYAWAGAIERARHIIK